MLATARVSVTAIRTCPVSRSAEIGGQRTWQANQSTRLDWVCVERFEQV